MAIQDRLRAIFGWSGGSPPPDKRRKSQQDQSQYGGANPYQAYSSAVKPPYDRRRRYDIYDEMDEMEMVSSILDAYAEDSTQFDREKKSSVWIEAEDKNVKGILDDLFSRLKVEELVEAICRDVAKYGDDFAELDIDKDKIVGWDWRDPRDIERIENRQGTLVGFEETKNLKNIIASAENGDSKLKLTYKPWDLVHFRLYRRKREWKQKYRNIYGTSILAGSERIAKQVKILDDMLMVRRLTKTLDTRVYKIDTGRSAVEEEVLILKRWKNALKRRPFIDPASKRFDSPFDPFTFQEDLFWPVREGSGSEVEVIPGQPNVADIVDVEHFRDKFFGSLRAPKGYFGYEGDLNAKATLSSQDMKWGRGCNSVQRAVRNGLTRVCQIELALNDIDAMSAKFSVQMVPPSVLEDLSRLESVQTQIDIAERMASLGETLGLNSDEWRKHILRSVVGLTDHDIKKYSSPPGSGDEPDDKDPPDDVTEPEKIDEVRSLILKKLSRTVLEGHVTESVRESELPHKNNRDAYAFHKGRIVPVTILEKDDESHVQ